MLNTLNWININISIQLQVAILIYKITHNLMPEYLMELMSSVANVPEHNTRHRHDQYLPLVSKSGTMNSIFYNGVRLYNSILVDVRNVASLRIFKNLISMNNGYIHIPINQYNTIQLIDTMLLISGLSRYTYKQWLITAYLCPRREKILVSCIIRVFLLEHALVRSYIKGRKCVAVSVVILIDHNLEYCSNQNFRNILTEANKDANDLNVEANFPPIQTARSRRKPKMYYE